MIICSSEVMIILWAIQGPCPNCGAENLSFFGTILSVSSGGETNKVKCAEYVLYSPILLYVHIPSLLIVYNIVLFELQI